MQTIYEPLATKDTETGLFYKIWEIPSGFPIPYGMTATAPSSNLSHPKWDETKGIWVEDQLSVVDDFTKDKEVLEEKVSELEQKKQSLESNQQELYAKLDSAESTILDLADMIFAAQQ